MCALTCAVQSYRFIRLPRNLERHKIWSFRLYAVILGAVLYRLYATVYYSLVLFTPWQGCVWVNNLLFYGIALPNLAVVELLLWQRQRLSQVGILRAASVFVALTGSLIFGANWLPAMLGMETNQGEVLKRQTVTTTTSLP